MVNVEVLRRSNFAGWHAAIVALAWQHGDRRVRQASLDWLAETVTDETVNLLPYSILFATDSEKVIGVSVATSVHEGPNFTVVHREYRRRGVARALIAAKIDHWPGYETLVALDNEPSLRLMFSLGLVAVGLADNGGGKNVLRFARNVSTLTIGLPDCILQA